MRRRGQTAGSAWLRVAACLLATGAAGAAAAPADAYTLLGQRWPGTTIRYHNLAPSYEWSVQQAVRAWNTSGTRLRFVKSSQARAHVVIRATSAGGGACWGNATAGSGPPCVRQGARPDRPFVRALRRGRGPRPRARPRPRTGPRGPALRDDELSALGALPRQPSGGPVAVSPRGTRRRSRCGSPVRRVREAGGPAVLLEVPAATGSRLRHGHLESTVWRGRARALEEHDVGGPDRGPDRARARRLPATPDGGEQSWSESADPGTTQTLEDFGAEPLPTGRYCYALWSFDAADRTTGPTTVWVDHVDGFLPPIEPRARAESDGGRLHQALVDELGESAC